MSHFSFRDSVLCAERLSLATIAASVDTPCFVYSTAAMEAQFTGLDDALAAALPGRNRLIAYAVKANDNLATIATFAKLGAGADIVSEGELRRALAADISADKIVFAGVGKRREEIDFALSVGVGQFSVESANELDVIESVAAERGVRGCFAIRVNPDVDPKTHAKIATGLAETKFGVPIGDAADLYARAAGSPHLDPIGIGAHIGSQLTQLFPYESAFERLVSLARTLRANGAPLRRIDFGGGLGVAYHHDETTPDPADYARIVAKALGDFDCDIVFEPGRYLVANAGVMVSRVIYIKQGTDRKFLVCDAAMNDLMRPALYDAYHHIETVIEPTDHAACDPIDIVGPVCEATDIFARGRFMPPVAQGDLIAFYSAGAYASVMGSQYNTRPCAPEVMVRHDEFEIIRPRPSYDEIIGRDALPRWLSR